MCVQHQQLRIGRSLGVVQPGIDLPGYLKTIACLVAAESQRLDVRANIGLQAFEITDRQGAFLPSLHRLVCPQSDQDTEGDDDEFAECQSPAAKEAPDKTRNARTIFRHISLPGQRTR